MKRELGIARCGLACCLCSENENCGGCVSDDCPDKDWCENRRCSAEKGLLHCYACGEDCKKGLLGKIKPYGFSLFVKRYGEEELLNCLERNEAEGIVYHREGILGDYDDFTDVEELIDFIRTGKRKASVTIRRFEPTDAERVSEVIVKTLRTSNAKDYSKEYIENDVSRLQPSDILQESSWVHLYVAESDGEIVGCGGIGPYWGKEDESTLFTIFVLPEHQGKGIGRRIVETLEKDEYFLRAKRIEIPASVTGVPFYVKMGYGFKFGTDAPDDEGLVRMEKFR